MKISWGAFFGRVLPLCWRDPSCRPSPQCSPHAPSLLPLSSRPLCATLAFLLSMTQRPVWASVWEDMHKKVSSKAYIPACFR
ncbi:hypothetical protein B0H12DRAFT_623001 [Mycena haematopus]|nr:hypothetical protein B0H12DRAFT_623001 [Mycena haematopus]